MTAQLISMGSIYLMGMLDEPVQSYLAGRMTELGVDVIQRRIIREEKEILKTTLKDAFLHAQTVLLTGDAGLSQPEIGDMLAGYFSMGKETTGNQAGSFTIPAPKGKQDGVIFRSQDQILIVLPGDQETVKDMFEADVVGYLLKDTADGKASIIMESDRMQDDEKRRQFCREIEEKLGELADNDNPSVRIKEHDAIVEIKIRAVGPGTQDARILAQMMAGEITRRIGTEKIRRMYEAEEE